jgi:hypothetical protein
VTALERAKARIIRAPGTRVKVKDGAQHLRATAQSAAQQLRAAAQDDAQVGVTP